MTRSEGRKIAKNIASENPNLKKIVYACKKLNLEYQAQPEKSHPSRWWENNGRILIPIDKDNKISKNKILKKLADIIRRLVPKKKVQKKKAKSKKFPNRTPPVR